MRDSSVPDSIEELEAQIEALSETIEQSRKLDRVARLMIAGAAIWLALLLFRILPFSPFGYVTAIAAMIGGIVLFGSNASTWRQSEAARERAERLRAELIDALDLSDVNERRRLH